MGDIKIKVMKKDEFMSYKVAICQSAIIPGGRLRVLLGIIDVLNEMGIEPDAFTSKITFRPDEIKGSYGKAPKVNFHLMPNIPLPYEFSVILFCRNFFMCLLPPFPLFFSY